jgi:hypothetical protein
VASNGEPIIVGYSERKCKMHFASGRCGVSMVHWFVRGGDFVADVA